MTYVQNFTDIDDKILNRARAEHSSMDAVSEKYIAAYFEDMDRLNIRKILHIGHLKPAPLQVAPQRIPRNVRSCMAQVAIVIDRNPAAINRYFARL